MGNQVSCPARRRLLASGVLVMSHADFELLQSGLGYRFKDESLLRLALTHRSAATEAGAGPGSNERLEFLGDAVLGLVIAEYLYSNYPEMSEGQMTMLRSALVRQKTLADVAQRLELGRHLEMGRGEDASGGRTRPRNQARALEAVFGAVAVDGGMGAARPLVLRLLEEALGAALAKGAEADPKSRLQELVQSRGASAPAYRTVQALGPEHDRRFVVEVVVRGEPVARGEGRSKRQAEESAAATAYELLSETSPG